MISSHSLSKIIWLASSLLGKTWRVKTHHPGSIKPFSPQQDGVFCFWHSRLLAISYVFRNTGKTAVVSSSRDGKLAAQVARLWNHDVIFGSSSRGGSSALRQCFRVLRDGRPIGITPDGPKGPAQVVKPGVAQLSLKSKKPVIIMTVRASSAWRLKSWDRFMIPKPFSRLTVELSDPIDPLAFSSEDNPEESLRAEIQKRMHKDDTI
ncbi:lysophospholipid acyltransferase family protein [Chitinispirillales bacterium ANBcel5]|uniref:lysophospholipid acyltransferase family protein n=1 Tax=Cellulosispirillum alkaliphilum TaxID=3039283 RepID=UPI002A4E4929|nr:lysophospholipid acyltransferase family protein [Chitinispirillales bacterium ANBcel5]